MTVLGVSEIVLNVDDLPAMRKFYQDVLNFPLVSEACFETSAEETVGGEPTITFLQVAEQSSPLGRNGHPQLLALIDHRRHIFAQGRIEALRQKASHLNHLAFEITPDSYSVWLEKLDAAQVETTETRFAAFRAKAIFFRDVEGNVIELICHEPSMKT